MWFRAIAILAVKASAMAWGTAWAAWGAAVSEKAASKEATVGRVTGLVVPQEPVSVMVCEKAAS